ncbi:unnamed protein product [Cylicocyclus nassatus]|uniref:Metalloendopeptidase n=1 Tax=Cylicocyclus nassatus TaxID=53992 RepID=A0AA36MAS0_CYLNA|nr:unnamed protein product [Cylicocyclus nassatus]
MKVLERRIKEHIYHANKNDVRDYFYVHFQLLETDESEKRSAGAVNRKHFKGLAIFSSEPRIWPGAVVPYELVPYLNDTQRGHVRYAINAFQKNTCIKFRKRTERDMYYLLITAIPKKWCYSVIGRDISSHPTNEGKFISDLNMDPDCFNRPAMIHELMHSIGFYHEHQREDRDPLVTAGPPEFPDPARDYANRGMTISRTQAQYMGGGLVAPTEDIWQGIML